MKVKPKLLYSDKFNEDDFDGFHINYIYPKDDEVRIAYEHKIRQSEMFDNDFYDEDVDYDTFQSNKVRKFTEKIPLVLYDLLTETEKIAYHQFLIDLIADNT